MARTARPVRSLITPCVRFFRESGRHFYLINAVRSAATVIRRPGTIVKLNELGSPERHNVRARARARKTAGCYRDRRALYRANCPRGFFFLSFQICVEM